MNTSTPVALPLAFEIDRRRPRAPQVYATLREAILDLRLKPGTPISENRICQQAEVSRTPVREAIIRLAQEELISVFPQQGSFVAPIRLKKVVEASFAREALETSILMLASAVWTGTNTEAAEEILQRQRNYAAAGDHLAFFREDENFHFIFAKVAGVEGILNIIRDAATHLVRIRRLANPVAGHMEQAIAEHQFVLENLHNGATEKAITTLRQHLSRVFTTLTRLSQSYPKYFEDQGGHQAAIPEAMRRYLTP
jgi:DNA-binding GntR family transcriptional regulator